MSSNNSIIVQVRRGNTAQTSTFTGALAELTVDTNKNTLVVHDGATVGGTYLAREDYTQAAFDAANSAISGTAQDEWSRNQANSAYNQANTGTIIAQAAFDSANNVAPQIQPSFDTANAAYNQANTGTIIAQAAFDKANTESSQVFTQAAYDQANTNAGAITVIQGVDLTQNTNISNLTAYAVAGYAQANTGIVLAQEAFNEANTAYNAASDAYNFATGVSVHANAAYNQANTGTVLAQSSFDTANTKLNLSGGEITGSLTVDGQANVYQRLSVGIGSYTILPNLISQFTGTSDYYSQINQQNLSGKGSGDIVVTADNGTDEINFIDLGFAGSVYEKGTPNSYPFTEANDGYLVVIGNPSQNFGGNLTIGTTGSALYSDIAFVQGSGLNEVARFKNSQGLVIKTGTSATDTTSGALVVEGGLGVSGALYAGSVYDNGIRITSVVSDANTAMKSYVDTSNTSMKSYVDGTVSTANTNLKLYTDGIVSANLSTAEGYTDTANTKLKSYVDGQIAIIQGKNDTQNTNIGNVNTFTGAAFNKANNSGIVAQAAYDTANTKFNTAGGTITGDTIVTGNLTVNGTTFYANTTNLQVEDNVITVNSNVTGTPTLNAGLEVNRGNQANTSVLWNESNKSWEFTNDGTNYDKIASGFFANASFDKANTVDVLAQTAFDSGNTTNTYATAGFNKANNAYDQANTGTTLAQSSFDAGNNTLIYAQSAYAEANATQTYATAGYGQANTATILAQAAYNSGNTTLTYVTAGYDLTNATTIYAQAAYSYANTTEIYAQSGYGQANTATTLAQAAFDSGNTTEIYAQSAYTKANTNASDITIIQGVDATQNTNITNATTLAQAAYTKANTGGTLTGATHITDVTQSTTSSSGALIVDGGAGIAKNLNVGGNAIIAGDLTIQGTQYITSTTTTSYSNPIISLHTPATGYITNNDGYDIGIDYQYYSSSAPGIRVITGGSANGTFATLNISDSGYLVANSVVTVAGVTPSSFNGTYSVSSSTSGTVTFPLAVTDTIDTPLQIELKL